MNRPKINKDSQPILSDKLSDKIRDILKIDSKYYLDNLLSNVKYIKLEREMYNKLYTQLDRQLGGQLRPQVVRQIGQLNEKNK